MIMTAHVLGQWTPQRTPQLLVDYPHPSILQCDDVTGTADPPPSPNAGVWEIRADEAEIDLMDADPGYMVLWSEYETTE